MPRGGIHDDLLQGAASRVEKIMSPHDLRAPFFTPGLTIPDPVPTDRSHRNGMVCGTGHGPDPDAGGTARHEASRIPGHWSSATMSIGSSPLQGPGNHGPTRARGEAGVHFSWWRAAKKHGGNGLSGHHRRAMGWHDRGLENCRQTIRPKRS